MDIFFFFISIGANILASSLTSETKTADANDIVRLSRFVKSLTLASPMELYTDATATIIDPMRKSTRSIVAVGPIEKLSMSRFSGPLSLGQSVLIVGPYIVSLISITIICFAVCYTVFMRQEIRSI
jgi:ABC-2 type transport system permease protein